jgi:ribonuclease E
MTDAEREIARREAEARGPDSRDHVEFDAPRGRDEAEATAAPMADASPARVEGEPFALADADRGEQNVAMREDGTPLEPRGEGSRRRGRGRGRGPREGDVQASANAAAGFEGESTDASPRETAPMDESRAPVASPAQANVAPGFGETGIESETVDADARNEPAAHAPVVTEPVAKPVARVEPKVAPRSEPVPLTSYALPVQSLEQVAESAGLQWVNSDAGKIEAAQAAMAAAAPPPAPPREIRVAPVVEEGPLVLVETKKDLSQVRLPFETASQEAQGPL